MKNVKPLKVVNTPGNAMGCICPPGSERTCKNPQCPRQDHRTLKEKLHDGAKRFIPVNGEACDKYRTPKGVMGGACMNCGHSQPEHARKAFRPND